MSPQSMKIMKDLSTHDLDSMLQSQPQTNDCECSDDDEEVNIAIESTKYGLIIDVMSDSLLIIGMWMISTSRSWMHYQHRL